MTYGNLSLTRAEGQSVKIGENVWVTVTWARNGQAQLSIRAPKSVPILRDDAIKTTANGDSK